MTYPSGSGVINNQWGPAYPNAPAGSEPPATGSIIVPQSPSGSVTGQAAVFNFTNTITSTEEFLSDVIVVDDEQQGSAALNAPCSFNTLNAALFQTFRWE
jgi:hypothetical protein